ncbi:MAG TPA: metallophosphoesterase [Actinomycetota bacterium]|nr:metallophosphoesterase [Actinomycetota bacterium]
MKLGKRTVMLLAVAGVGLAGTWLGVTVGAKRGAALGPFDVELSGAFGSGQTEIVLPPLGRVTADTHAPPLSFRATLREVEIQELTRLVRDQSVRQLADDIGDSARRHVVPFGFQLLGMGILGALLLAVLVFRTNWRAVLLSLVVPVTVVGGSELAAWVTYDSNAFRAPRFSGSLALAPRLVGEVETAAARIDAFRLELQRIVSGAARVYSRIQTRQFPGDQIRVLHIADVHLSPLGMEFARQLAEAFDVDVVVDTGDLTSFGTPAEDLIARFVPGFNRPYLFVPGNHDGPSIEAAMARVPNVTVLNGASVQKAGVTFYGLRHPVFTPNKETTVNDAEFEAQARQAGERILREVQMGLTPPAVVAVHDDRMAEAVAGRVPVVISGHFHQPAARMMHGTIFLRTGTTGGSGFTVFTQEGGIPLSAQILYFEPRPQPTLLAFDRITQSPESGNLSVERHLVAEEFG